MASLFRQRGSPYWYASFFDSTGRRRHRSTKTRRKSEAVRVAAEFERLARRATAPELAERSENAAVLYRILEEAGTQALRGTLTETSARAFLNAILKAAHVEVIDCPTVEEWLDGWLAEKKQSRTEGTHERYESIIRSFLDSLPKAKRSAPLTALSISDVRHFRDAFRAAGRTPRTVNIAVKVVRSALAVARRHGYIAHNPAEAVESIAGDAEERQVFTPAQVAVLVAAAEGDWKGLILAGYYTGARLGDLSNLRWRSVNLDRRTIAFTQSKTKRPIEIPIHPELLRWVEGQTRDPSIPWIFPTLAPAQQSGRGGLSMQFRKIMEKAGIEPTVIERQGAKGRNRATLSFHSLRHSFNSEMANAGIPQELRQRLTGHASKAVNDSYTHTYLETLRKAVETVPPIAPCPSPGSRANQR